MYLSFLHRQKLGFTFAVIGPIRFEFQPMLHPTSVFAKMASESVERRVHECDRRQTTLQRNV